jgi:hypothetical protein
VGQHRIRVGSASGVIREGLEGSRRILVIVHKLPEKARCNID